MNKVNEHYLGENGLYVKETVPDKLRLETPLIFIHGAFGGAFVWDKFLEYFSEKGFKCYALSLRGHRLSKEIGLKGVALEDYVSDLRLITDYFSIKEPILIGHSMGGLIAFMYGEKYETKGIIGLDPALTKEFWDQERKNLIDEIPSVATMIDVGLHIKPEKIIGSIPDIDVEDLAQYAVGYRKESGKALIQMIQESQVDPQKIKDVSIYIISADYDRLMPFSIPNNQLKKMAKKYNAQFINMKGVSHVGMLYGEKYERVAKKVNKYLNKICK